MWLIMISSSEAGGKWKWLNMLKMVLKFLIVHQGHLRICLCPLLKYVFCLNWQIPFLSTILGDI